jgi:3-oxoacyl-[acyl-carrier-protein] synthase-3
LLVPHQANIRILQSVAQKLGLEEGEVISTVAEHANTSAASIPLALDAAKAKGLLKNGKIVALSALGAGLTWGSCIIRW